MEFAPTGVCNMCGAEERRECTSSLTLNAVYIKHLSRCSSTLVQLKAVTTGSLQLFPKEKKKSVLLSLSCLFLCLLTNKNGNKSGGSDRHRSPCVGRTVSTVLVLATGQTWAKASVGADLTQAWFPTTQSPSALPRKKGGMALIGEDFGS